MQFNWQFAASSFHLISSIERAGGVADGAGFLVVFLADVCCCNRAITLFVIRSDSWACHGAARTLTDYGCREGVAALSANTTGTLTTAIL